MARDLISTAKNDLMSDKGSVLLSLVRGEQFEFAIVCDFLEVATSDFTYEAVVMEGLNDGKGTKPSAVQPDITTPVTHNRVESTLQVRVPLYRSDWVAATAYNTEDVVDYTDGKSYRLLLGTSRVSSVTPDTDPYWVEHDKRTVYVQFPSTFCVNAPYYQLPLPDKPSYGFFELRVTESGNPVYNSTWKPARGLVQILFSPTELV